MNNFGLKHFIFEKLTSIFFVLSLFISNTTYGQQNNSNVPLEWIGKVTSYRDFLLRKNPEALIELRTMLTKWDTLGTGYEEKIEFSSSVLKVRAEGYSYKAIRRMANRSIPESILAKTFIEEDVITIEKNSELLNLIFLGVLEPTYPFKIDPKTNFFIELLYYQIKPNIKIGEIGAGIGMFSFMVKLLYGDVELYINEVDKDYVKYTSNKIKLSNEVLNIEKLYTIQGRKKSTQLEGKDLDIVIVRNSFHHFSNKEKMLESIKQSMKPGAHLFLKEAVKELDQDQQICKLAMTKVDIVRWLTEFGFEIVDEVDYFENVIIKAQLK